MTFEDSPARDRRGRSPARSPATQSKQHQSNEGEYNRKLNQLKSLNVYMQKSRLYNTYAGLAEKGPGGGVTEDFSRPPQVDTNPKFNNWNGEQDLVDRINDKEHMLKIRSNQSPLRMGRKGGSPEQRAVRELGQETAL